MEPYVLAFLGGTTLTAVIAAFFNRRKTSAEAMEKYASAEGILSTATMQFATMLRKEAEGLRKRLDDERARAAKLEVHAASLEDQIKVQLNHIAELRNALRKIDPKHPLLSSSHYRE